MTAASLDANFCYHIQLKAKLLPVLARREDSGISLLRSACDMRRTKENVSAILTRHVLFITRYNSGLKNRKNSTNLGKNMSLKYLK